MIRVKAAFFSMSAPLGADAESYLRWHLLDHMPEQYQLPGIQLALRYIADGDHAGGRIVAEGNLRDVGNLVNYLVGDPVQRTHDDFMELGPRLAERGRFPLRIETLHLRMPALLAWYAAPRALISAEVVPYRPHRGVVVVVEEAVGDDAAVAAWMQWTHREHLPEVLSTPGVAGVWVYGDTRTWELHPRVRGDAVQYTTVVYLDEDPLRVAGDLRPLLEARWASGAVRPRFAGPLRTMIDWEAWR